MVLLTKQKQGSTLENDVDVAPFPFRYFIVVTSVQDSVLFRVQVEEKIRHYTLSSPEWNNVLCVTPSRENPPLRLVDHQSRLSLGSTDMGGNVDQKASVAEGTPGVLFTHVAGDWTDRNGSDLDVDSNRVMLDIEVEIVPTSLRVVGTTSPGSSVWQ